MHAAAHPLDPLWRLLRVPDDAPVWTDDFSNLLAGNPPEPFVAATVWPAAGAGFNMLELRAGVAYRLGGMPVLVPDTNGDYTLDLLNLANTDDSNFGMVLEFGFGGFDDPVTKWASAADGQFVDDVITYANGPLMLTVIPEPATLLFLAPAAALLAIRRSARVGAARA